MSPELQNLRETLEILPTLTLRGKGVNLYQLAALYEIKIPRGARKQDVRDALYAHLTELIEVQETLENLENPTHTYAFVGLGYEDIVLTKQEVLQIRKRHLQGLPKHERIIVTPNIRLLWDGKHLGIEKGNDMVLFPFQGNTSSGIFKALKDATTESRDLIDEWADIVTLTRKEGEEILNTLQSVDLSALSSPGFIEVDLAGWGIFIYRMKVKPYRLKVQLTRLCENEAHDVGIFMFAFGSLLRELREWINLFYEP